MKYWEEGFYLEQNEDNTRIEISDEKWQELLEEQTNGKIIYLDNGELKTKDYELSEEEIKQNRIEKIKELLTELNYDFMQYFSGEDIEDIEERKQRFIELHNELRSLLGKEERKVRGGDN